MEQNPYQPPRGKLQARSREPGSLAKAVAIGAVIDIGGTMLGGIVIALAYAVMLGVQGHSTEMIQQTLSNVDRWSIYGILLTAMGILMSVLGGFQCAVIANRNTYLAPGILSLISVAFGAIGDDGRTELPVLLFFSAVTVASILGGASLYIRKLIEPAPKPAAED